MPYIDKEKALNLDFRINVSLFESRRKTAERAVQAYADAIRAIPEEAVRAEVKGGQVMEDLHLRAVDGHHVWINGRQFISLNRVNQMTAAYRDEIEWLKKCVNDLPKPVRCRDCIHLSGVTNGGTFFRCDRYDRWQDESNRVYMPLDGFCSYGQKKEET